MTCPVFDLHCDTADRLAWQSLPADLRRACGRDFFAPGDETDPAGCRDLARNRGHVSLEAIGDVPWAQCFACFVPDELSPEQAARLCAHVRGHLGREVARNDGRVTLVRRAAEVRGVLDAGGVAAVQTIENARMFAHDLGLVGELAGEGLLMASLTWNAAGPLASGVAGTGGLTELGRQVVAEMGREGVVLDVSHLNEEGFWEVARLSRLPIVASHSNARAVCDHPRNLTDDQFRAIRDAGGVVGLNFCAYFITEGAEGPRTARVSFDEMAAHVEHWLDLGGEGTVALGGDLDGADVPACADGARKMPELQALLARRFGEGLRDRLCYRNALEFFERMGRA